MSVCSSRSSRHCINNLPIENKKNMENHRQQLSAKLIKRFYEIFRTRMNALKTFSMKARAREIILKLKNNFDECWKLFHSRFNLIYNTWHHFWCSMMLMISREVSSRILQTFTRYIFPECFMKHVSVTFAGASSALNLSSCWSWVGVKIKVETFPSRRHLPAVSCELYEWSAEGRIQWSKNIIN